PSSAVTTYSPDRGIEHNLPRAVLAPGEARARERIRSDPRPTERRSPNAKRPWLAALRRFWLLASLLVGHRGVAAMLPPPPSPETKSACNKLYSILRAGEYYRDMSRN